MGKVVITAALVGGQHGKEKTQTYLSNLTKLLSLPMLVIMKVQQ